MNGTQAYQKALEHSQKGHADISAGKFYSAKRHLYDLSDLNAYVYQNTELADRIDALGEALEKEIASFLEEKYGHPVPRCAW